MTLKDASDGPNQLGGVLAGGSLLWFREELGHATMWLVFSSLYLLAVELLLSLDIPGYRAMPPCSWSSVPSTCWL